MKILVTGATGFIGNAVVEALAREHHAVHALVRTSACKTSRIDRLRAQGTSLIVGDITDCRSLDAIGGSFDAVIHAAAYVENKDWERLYAVNVLGTENMCRLALRLGVARFIHISSIAVTSGSPAVPQTDDLALCATNLYGRSKIEAEQQVALYRARGLRAAIVRPPMVYGEGEPHLLEKLLALLKFRLLPVIDGGKALWHLAYVKHVAQAVLLALYADELLEGSFFVADKEVLTAREIFSLLAKGINAPDPVVLPGWLTPVCVALPVLGTKARFFLKDRVFDIGRIEKAGYRPRLSAQEALYATARFYAASGKRKRGRG